MHIVKSKRKFKSKRDELLSKMTPDGRAKRNMEGEHHLQCACVQWFESNPAFKTIKYFGTPITSLLFSVPNGGLRHIKVAAKLKREGVRSGVSDLILLYPSKPWHALCIEMKLPSGVQSPTQKAWQRLVESFGYRYVVCKSLEAFIDEINGYLFGDRPYDSFFDVQHG